MVSCGDVTLTAAGTERITRRPFLQQVTDQSAIVALGLEGDDAVAVEVTTPAGKLVLSADVELETAASIDGPSTFVARLNGLEPGTAYCYALPGLMGRMAFQTAPRAGSDAPVRFVAFGDSGTGNVDQRSVLRQIESVPFDFFLHLGDLAYERGTPTEIEAKFFRVYAPVLQSFPAYVVAGNHEYATRDAAPLRQAFVLPENGTASGRERYYSFDYGNVHFVAIDTELIGPEQARWLERDLESRQPWKVVFAHRPPFSSGEHGADAAFQQVFVPILERHRVDLVLAGHEHHYERFAGHGSVTYVVTGGGGRETREAGHSSGTVFSEAVLHFVYVEVSSNLLVLHAIDGVGREFDQAVILHAD
jgi:hypothetical protein